MKLLKQIDLVRDVFICGVKEQLKQEWTWGAAAALGLHQGLKYSGNIKNGVAGGVATLVVIASLNGAHNVVVNWDQIKGLAREV